MSEQNLNSTVQELLDRMSRMQAELDNLKTRSQALPQTPAILPPGLVVSTTRRKVLRRLAGGLVAGLAVGSIGVGIPQEAEAKLSSNPSANGQNGRVGMLVVPPGTTVSNNLGGGSTRVGLVVSGDSPAFDISVFTPTVNAAILASTANNGSAIVGQTQTGTGVYGQSNTGIGVSGAITGTSTSSIGVYGSNSSGIGVIGTSSSNYGVKGISTSNYGVVGNSTSSIGVTGNSSSGDGVAGGSLNGIGVHGLSNGSHGVSGYTTVANGGGFDLKAGVFGSSIGTGGVGVYGSTTGSGSTGVFGVNTGDNGVAVFGSNQSTSAFSYAGYFNDRVQMNDNLSVIGSVSKGGGSFKIDHPLDPANKYLYHSFVESPDMMNIYNGLVTLDEQGEAVVEMPEWFDALNSDFRYQLTCLGQYAQVYIAEEMKERKFKIAGGQSGQKVSWMVTGIRQDEWAKAHRIPVEEDKTDRAKGKYLHPELFGQPEEMSIHPRRFIPADISK